MKAKHIFAGLCVAASAIAGRAWAQDPAPAPSVSDPAARGETPESQKGYDISARSDRTDVGFGDSEVAAKMIVRDAAGGESVREFMFTTLERADETVGDKTLILFTAPRLYDGAALLSHAKILDPDGQWLFRPARKQVTRITTENKSGSFLGSEFAFEDFTTTELNKFTYKYVGEEMVGDLKVDVIERYPRYENSGYTRQVAYVDQDVFQVRKVEFYDRKDALLKTLTLSDYREYGGIWRSHLLEMVNAQTKKETDLVYEEYEFGVGLNDRDFEPAVLRRLQ